eukprot:7743702-Pyramimonas_sp.AAC.1
MVDVPLFIFSGASGGLCYRKQLASGTCTPLGRTPPAPTRQESRAFLDARMTLLEERARHWAQMVYTQYCTTVECTTYHYDSDQSESGHGMLPQLSFRSWVFWCWFLYSVMVLHWEYLVIHRCICNGWYRYCATLGDQAALSVGVAATTVKLIRSVLSSWCESFGSPLL